VQTKDVFRVFLPILPPNLPPPWGGGGTAASVPGRNAGGSCFVSRNSELEGEGGRCMVRLGRDAAKKREGRLQKKREERALKRGRGGR
jgi:hypothetical protein